LRQERILRAQQDAEYERALAVDRAKVQERKRLESEKAEKSKEEEERRQEKQKPIVPEVRAPELGDWKSHIAATSSSSSRISVALRLPSGKREVLDLNGDCKLVVSHFCVNSSKKSL
jgi:hypothetical protein